MPDADGVLACEVLAVVVTMRRSPALARALDSLRAAGAGHDLGIVCVVNDPACRDAWLEDGVHYRGTGLNLGWAAGMHAGVLQTASTYVWAIQDDLEMLPGALGHLADALDADPGLASVRPLRVDADGIVATGSQGWYLDDRPDAQVPSSPTPADEYEDLRPGDFLLSSGQLIRRRAWDEVGGFDPWFHPWGFVDIDFGRTLTESGWRFASVRKARMLHAGGASATSNLRTYLYSRNQSLFRQKWAETPEPEPEAPAVSPWIVERVRESRGRPRTVDLAGLREIVSVVDADIVPSMAAWLPEFLRRRATPPPRPSRSRWLRRRS